jgi:adenylate cyclase
MFCADELPPLEDVAFSYTVFSPILKTGKISLTVQYICLYCLRQITVEACLLTSKELLEKTGISRATLNNYISWGIVPKPEVLPPEPRDGAAPRIGYFPDDVVARIEEIQRLKREGWSITRIAEHFSAQASPTAGTPSKIPATSTASSAAQPGVMPSLAIDDIAHPAYIINNRFQVVWFNAAAGAGLLRALAQARTGAEPQNVFKYLLRSQAADATSREQILRFHLGLAKQHGLGFAELCRGVSEEEAGMLERLFNEAQRPDPGLVSQTLIAGGGGAAAQPVRVYAVQFRERILLVHVPGGRASEDLSPLLVSRELVTGAPEGKRRPELSQVAVLVADLQHPTRIWSELPAEEYFELINQIWLTVDPIFRRHHGTHGKHPGDGMVCYFFPQRDSSHVWNALAAAQEMREAMRRVSKEWQLRKRWATELYMNTGLDEGQQWLGTLKSAGQLEFTMLGDTLNQAARISDFARFGSIWATKNLIGKLTLEQKQRLKFGVRRKSSDGREVFVPSIFSNVDSLADGAGVPVEKLKDIARLPITEIVEIAAPDRGSDSAAPNPT